MDRLVASSTGGPEGTLLAGIGEAGSNDSFDGGRLLLFFCRLRRQNKITAAATSVMNASPPTTAPAITPALVFFLVDEGVAEAGIARVGVNAAADAVLVKYTARSRSPQAP